MALEFYGADTSDSTGVTVTSGTAPNYGSYVEITSSTGIACEEITVHVVPTSIGGGVTSILEIASGPASSEVPLFELPLIGSSGGADQYYTVTFPYSISSGTRLAARLKASSGTRTADVSVAISSDNSYGTGLAATLIGQSGTQGTTIDPGGTANTKGSWTELVASSPHDFDFLYVLVGNNANSVATAASWLIDIGTGAAASETVAIEDVPHLVTIFEAGFTVYPIRAPIASGTRIAARAQCSITDATDRLIDVTVLGVNLTAPSGGGSGGGGETAHVFAC